MSEKITPPKKKKAWLTARQVGMIAAIGGLGFTWRALGLVIPLLPPYLLDIRETVNVIAAVAGGPFVAIGVGLLIGLPSAIPMMDIVYYPFIGIFLSIFTKTIYKHRHSWGYVLLLPVLAIAEAIGMLYSAWLLDFLGIASFWPFLIASFGITYWIYVIQMFVPLIIIIELFPEFMKPMWSWRGGEITE